MSRYKHADLLRNYERLNISSGANWLEGAARRYKVPELAPMGGVSRQILESGTVRSLGVDTAPAMTRGVDTLAYVGSADGLGGLVDGEGMLIKFPLTSTQKLMAVAALAFHGYKRGVDKPDSWEGAALYSGFSTPKSKSKFKTF